MQSDKEISQPYEYLYRDLIRVVESRLPPAYSSQQLITLFHLNEKISDGKTLGQRLFNEDEVRLSFRDLIGMICLLKSLLVRLENRTETSHELTLAHNLAALLMAQINREGDICVTARRLAVDLAQARPEILNLEVIPQAREKHEADLGKLGPDIAIDDTGWSFLQ